MPVAPPAATDVERRKKVRLRLRRDLEIAPQKYEGRTYYVVKDPVSLRYYRFKEQEHFLIQLMDGDHSLDDAQKEYEKRFRPERLTLEDLEGFGQQLLTAGLAQNESPRAAAPEDLAAHVDDKQPLIVRNVADAISVAIERARDSDAILIAGSLYNVGEARRALARSSSEER